MNISFFKTWLAFFTILIFASPAFASQKYTVARKDNVRYYRATDANGNPITVFKTKKGKVAQLIEVDGDYVLGIPGILDIGTVGVDGLHLGPEVLGTGVGFGIGPSGVGVAVQIFGYGIGAGITPFKGYIGPRREINCPPLYNADGQGYRDCR